MAGHAIALSGALSEDCASCARRQRTRLAVEQLLAPEQHVAPTQNKPHVFKGTHPSTVLNVNVESGVGGLALDDPRHLQAASSVRMPASAMYLSLAWLVSASGGLAWARHCGTQLLSRGLLHHHAVLPAQVWGTSNAAQFVAPTWGVANVNSLAWRSVSRHWPPLVSSWRVYSSYSKGTSRYRDREGGSWCSERHAAGRH